MFAKFFIDRPVVAGVLSIIIVIAGIVGGLALPVAQFPEILPPTVVVNASYPGASAETIARTVAAPIEERLSGVENLLYFSSSVSSNGEMALTATFDVGTDIDAAVFNVNNRVQLALPRLPEEVRRIGVVVQKRSADILLLLSLTSPDNSRDALYLSNYATITLIDELKRVPGVGDVTQFGARDYAMRIWLRPDRLAQLGLTVSDVANALRAQNAQYAAGKIGAEPAQPGQSLVYTVTAQGRLVEPEQFGEIVLRADPSTGVLRLKDVARIELGAQSYDAFNTLDGKPAVSMAVFLQSGGNALEVANAVKLRLKELKDSFPTGVEALAPFDPTRYVEASIDEVTLTFLQAGALVILVVFLFLQNWRATLIPMIAVPISLIGTLAGLWLAGFSINTLTLFAMVLAIGIVVDDAIVVLENVERLMREERLDPWHASVKAMQQVSGAVIAIVIVLCAVFVPVAFLGGIAGQLYRQFAVTVAIAVVISGVVALTLTPTLCALLLRDTHSTARWAERFNRAFSAFSEYFLGWVRLALVHRGRALLGFAAVVALTGLLLWRLPGSFVPAEDQGQLLGNVQLPDGATLQRTGAVTARVQKMISDSPSLDYVIIVNGLDILGGGIKSSAATLFLPLRRWHEREQDAFEVANEFNGKLRTIREGNVFVINPAPIRGLGTAGGFELYVQARAGADPARLAQVLQQFKDQLAADGRLAGLNTFFRPSVPQLRVEIDREKTLALGVPVDEVFDALQSTMSALYVNDFNLYGRTFRVQMQAEAPFRNDPEDLGRIYVRSQTSQSMIPLKALMNVAEVVGPEQLERFNGFIAARIIGAGAPGVSSGQALAAVEELARANLPEGFDIAWTGQAFQEKRTGDSSVFAFVFALVMVFLILAALYGRWLLPVSVLLSVPFAICGALGLVMLRNTANQLYAGIGAGSYVEMTNDIYFQIGLVVLIGLTAKNAILIVEFAQREFLAGKSAIAAAMEAARLRLRPIIMTSLAFILGVLPLVIATGAGAAARRSMGTGVFGGMLIATFIATVFVPLFFVLVARRGRHVEVPAHDQHPPRDGQVLPAAGEAK
jgi:hydrophobe/amphiphile efflux-1 (HAE1) family protein